MRFLFVTFIVFIIILNNNFSKTVGFSAAKKESGRTLIVVRSDFRCPKSNFSLTRLGQEVKVFSPNYPFSYPNNINCNYSFSSPVNTRMKLKCHIALPHQFFNCKKHTGDSFVYSLIGNTTLLDRRYSLCGHYLLKSYSVANKLMVIQAASMANGTVMPGDGDMVPAKPSCGFVNPVKQGQSKIIGGEMARAGEFPWRCLVQVRMGTEVKKGCTCTIISNQWILSAVHCTIMEDSKNVFVFVGGNSFGASEAQSGLPVSEILQNSKYGGELNNDDTSLLRLSQPLEFSESVSPICLPCKFKGQQFIETELTVSGFVEINGTYNLLHKNLMTLNRLACMQLLPINSDEICIYEKGKEECVEKGETGSYSDYLDPETGLYYAAGIYSWDALCATEKKPSIHQNVARYLDWIETTTGQQFC